MSQTAELPTDFDILMLLVCKLEKFSYPQLQETVWRIQEHCKLFQNYFENFGDVEGVNPPESMQLSFHFKVLYQLGYIQREGSEYAVSDKCKQNEAGHLEETSELIDQLMPIISSH
jgi:hypothetical protein